MDRICLKLYDGTPQYVCTACRHCTSTYGKSMCKVKNRGCCWYFPKFTLFEVHKMSRSNVGRKILSYICSIKTAKIYNYYIHVKGYFDKIGLKKYLDTEECYENDVKDKSIFFRLCPFVKSREGCTLPQQYRSYVCNFFVCDDIKKKLKKHNEFNDYVSECSRYARWVNWENYSLEHILEENKLNLIDNFKGAVELLSSIPIENCEVKNLKEIEVL
ncbi:MULTISPECIES: hypothetical protein [Clostridium]|uniref:hypothetical protein n=1 Tax=Clostridium TaxID=1485 RepID=UPI0008269C3C|nr:MULTISPECIES: hypothetical protein [Clostridium]PJI08644.1 hypothetical protein CUB90_12565 [Clostridium sp. CT7]